ncbi:hypothetical protein MLD38_031133 [Melastoma candidum]|uniref:Uncharacterized protein n=1 Tax=Melastoma candidum TaxID=119954 RepID=A0ACB9MNR7_9MYRT|nr:hypothetical protein MLD38_031133 [Melastoma candidum]
MDCRDFWSHVLICMKAAQPFIKVLRLVDFDIPAMGFLYEYLRQTKKKIKHNFGQLLASYEPILSIIDERLATQLHRPLHAAAYFLNPQYEYRSHPDYNIDIKMDLYHCIK